jgi:hypothetical protein
MIEIVGQKVLESAAAGATKALVDVLKRENQKLEKTRAPSVEASFVATMHLVSASIARHSEEVKAWATTVRFSDLKSQKTTLSIYVELDTYLMPLSTHVDHAERENVRPLLTALAESPSHAAILGNPGAGKTTSLQKICADFFIKGKALSNYNFPILIRLREISKLTSNHPIFDRLQQILGIAVVFPENKSASVSDEAKEALTRSAVAKYLDGLNALLLLDGFDEISSQFARDAALSDIEALANALRRSKLIVTSRSREFRYKLSNLDQFEIASLSKQQIKTFARRWLGSEQDASDFIAKVFASPFADTAIRPLTVAHLCAIYERIRTIPEKPRSVYKRIVNLLLEEWDSQRQVLRRSMYAGFDADRKLEFLSHLAFNLTLDGNLVFDDAKLRRVYDAIHFEHGLPAMQCTQVIEEVESHSGLITESSYKSYEFAHKSIQEYLAADYIVRLPSPAQIADRALDIPNELAIATALSSKPAAYFGELILRVLTVAGLEKPWVAIYLNRLALEKVEFLAGYTPEANWAAIVLLSVSDAPDNHISTLQPLLPTDLYTWVTENYSVHARQPEFVLFSRIQRHSEYSLPSRLRLPSSLM